MELFIELGKTFVEKLVGEVIEKSRYMFCFTCIIKEYREEAFMLEAEVTTMRQRARMAMMEGKDITYEAQFWEEQADKLIHEDTNTKERCFFGFCSDCVWKYKRGRDLANKIYEIKNLMAEAKEFVDVEFISNLPDVDRYSSQYFISFKSRELKFKELFDALKDDNTYITGLHGMGGTGKTTLAKEVGKELMTSGHFDRVVDTTVSLAPNIKKIQDDIVASIGLQWREIDELVRPEIVRGILTCGMKFLVILDDVWEQLNFDEIGIPNSDNHEGCKVLVTSRDLGVLKKMGCGKEIQLELLSEEDAWAMFKMYADLNNSSKQILYLGRQIATKCKRLPVAIATIASTLNGQKDPDEWINALNSLEKPMSKGDVDDNLVDVYRCLKLSYDCLNENTKGLFLLCSTFSKDEEISNEILTRLGIGVGLFGGSYDKYKDARFDVDTAKNKLLNSHLLLNTKKGNLKMDDSVRETAQWIANNEIQTVNFSNKIQKSLVERNENVKYLSCEGNLQDLVSSKFNRSKLEILIFNVNMWETVGIPISFFESISGLRVLSILNKSIILDWPTLSLPQSIQSLAHIRSLLVEGVDLGDISVLGSLHSLETLDLDDCIIAELPREIENLKKLRLLNLEKCEIRSNNPFEVIQRCPSLEELYFCNSFNNFCQEIMLPELERYRLTDGFSMMNDSRSKCVSFQKDHFAENKFRFVMETVEFLRLERIEKGWRNIMPEVVSLDQGMNDLIELHLKCDSQLECLIVIDNKLNDSQEQNVLSKLVVLHLEEMENLQELCNGPISFDSMKDLEEIFINCCKNLRSLFKCIPNLCNLKTVKLTTCSTLVSVFEMSTFQCLPLLENLKISDCEKLENIIRFERRVDGGDNDNKSFNTMFPKLKVVDIQRCHQLHFILPFLSSGDLLLLEVIIINSCHKLKYIFGQHQDVKLASLKEMRICDLPNFIDIFPKCYDFVHSFNSKTQIQLEPIKTNTFSSTFYFEHKLRASTSTKIPLAFEDQPKDCTNSLESSSYCLNIWEHVQCLSRQSHIIRNTTVIELVNISKITSLFILSMAPKMLVESLTIKNCDKLKHIVVDMGDNSGGGDIFPKLKELKVENCEKLEYIFGHIDASDYHDQNHNNDVIDLHLPALECLQFYSLPSLIGMCPKTYHTMFHPLTVIELLDCPKVVIKLVGDARAPYSISRYHGSSTIKELSGNVEHFETLERLKVNNSKVESVFCLNEVSEGPVNLGLQNMELHNLPMITCLFEGPKNSFALINLKMIKIVQCEILEIVFSTSVSRCLPQLLDLRIEQCKELKHIVEDDIENHRMSKDSTSNTCFPKLLSLTIVKCKNLKSVFPSSCKELPELEILLIREANELEFIFKSEGDDQIVQIPNLKVLAFVNLPSLNQTQGIQFQGVKNCFVQNCQKLSPTSSTAINIDDISNTYDKDYETSENTLALLQHLREEAKDQKLAAWINGVVAESRKFTSSQKLVLKQSTSQQYPLGEICTTINSSRGNNLEGSMSTVPETRNVPPIQLVDRKQKGVVISVEEEEGTISTSVKTITSSTHLELASSSSSDTLVTYVHKESSQAREFISIKMSDGDETTSNNVKKTLSGPLATSECETSSLEYGDGQITVPSPPTAITENVTTQDVEVENKQGNTKTNHDKDSQNDDVLMKISSNIEEDLPKDNETIVSKSSLSSIAPHFSSIPSKGDASEIVEDLSSSLVVTRELEK